MADIIDEEEVDRDTVESESLLKQFNKNYHLMSEITISPNKPYINKLHGTKSLKLALGLSDDSIQILELNNTSLNKVCQLSGHKSTLTEVVFCPKDDNLLYSSGHDGVLKLWDIRKGGTNVQEYKDEDDQITKPYDCMDVSHNGRVLCAGSQLTKDDAYLVFWDNRNNKPLGGYWNSHTDDITQVKFHRNKTEILASGSSDGLLNIYNILESNEDDALTYSLNVENSVEKISWLDDKQVACITQSDDLQVWDALSGDLLQSYCRDKVARSIKRSKGDDCYLVDIYTSSDDTPVLLAGSHGGNGNILRSVCISDKKLQPHTNFSQNDQITRCCWYNKLGDVLVTGGEAGRLCAWRGEGAPGAGALGEGAPPAHGLTHSLKKLHVNRHKPY